MRLRINALTFHRVRAWRPLKGLTGLTALTALATLAVPAVASAPRVPPPPAALVTQTITNQASASSQRNGHTDWVLNYQFKQVSSAATLNVTNNATATATPVPPLRRRRDRLPGGGDIGAEPGHAQRDQPGQRGELELRQVFNVRRGVPDCLHQ